MQELLRHSSLRSTMNIYTQAVTPAKQAAQAAVITLLFSAEPAQPVAADCAPDSDYGKAST